MKNFVINNETKSELLFAIVNLISEKLNIKIDIEEDWFLNEDSEVYDEFDRMLGRIVYSDYVSENVLHNMGINGTSDLIEFYYECQKYY